MGCDTNSACRVESRFIIIINNLNIRFMNNKLTEFITLKQNNDLNAFGRIQFYHYPKKEATSFDIQIGQMIFYYPFKKFEELFRRTILISISYPP